jgi:tetratricopeptide (TPR) repeat protein
MGRFPEAKAQLARARELEPLSLIVNSVAGKVFYYARDHDAAVEQYLRTLDIDPDFWVAHLFLGQAYAQQARYEDAIAELQRSPTSLGPHPLTAYVYARMGKSTEAQRMLDQLQADFDLNYVSPYYVAVIYAGLDNRDQAFAWLKRAIDDRSFGVGLLKVEPMLDNLRSDPRFKKIIADMNFPP